MAGGSLDRRLRSEKFRDIPAPGPVSVVKPSLDGRTDDHQGDNEANHNNVPGAGWQSWVFDVSIRVTVAHVE